MGFCNAVPLLPSQTQIEENEDNKEEVSFVTEPPLGPRPDLIETNEEEPVYDEYDESRCEVLSVY